MHFPKAMGAAHSPAMGAAHSPVHCTWESTNSQQVPGAEPFPMVMGAAHSQVQCTSGCEAHGYFILP
jgi:hypothetical protein